MIRIRQCVARAGASIGVAFGLGLVCAALLLAHLGPGLGHMEEMDHDGGGPAKAVMSVCLAVAGAGAVLLGAWAGWRRPALLKRSIFRFEARGQTSPPSQTPSPAARAGPAQLQVFLR